MEEKRMNKTELIAAIASQSGLSKKDSEKALVATIGSISAELKKGHKVQLIGFGSFETKKRAARKGRNPKTNAQITIPASTYPVFKAGKALKEAVAKK